MLKGHCHDKVHVRTKLTPIFSTNSFTCLSIISLSAGFWPFDCKEYFSCLCSVKAVSVEYKHLHFTFFQHAFTSAAIESFRYSSSNLSFVFLFLFPSKQDKFRVKVTLVFNRFKNLPLRISTLKTVPSDRKSNCRTCAGTKCPLNKTEGEHNWKKK